MATPGFQLYADKENVSSIGGPMHKARSRHGIAPVLKIFGAFGGKTGFPTPVRKALGNMNRDPHVATPTFTPKQKNLLNREFKKPVLKLNGPTPIKRQPLSSKPVIQIQQDQQSAKQKSRGAEVVKPIVKAKCPVPDVTADIEKGFVYREQEDDFEDIWPKKDRPSSYLDALIAWRPPCFGVKEEIDEEREEEEWREELARRIREVDQIHLHRPADLDDEEPLPLVEVPPLTLSEPLVDVPLPSLDESLDIVQHIGSLTLKED